jgi:hypothetical protein
MSVSGTIGISITAVIAMAVTISISAGAPPTAIIWVPAETDPAITYTKTKSPSSPGVVVHSESPGDRSWIIIRMVPGAIPISGAVNYCPMICIRTVITRRIANIYNAGCIVINIYVFDIIHG